MITVRLIKITNQLTLKLRTRYLKKPIKIKKLAKIPTILILIQILKRQMRKSKLIKSKIRKLKQLNEISISFSLFA